MSDIGPELSEDEALAAEHALGLLSARERAAAEARMARDPAFAAAVDGWRLRLASMAEAIDAVPAPPGLWDRIERLLAVNDNGASVRRRLRFWRGATLAGMAMSAASLAAVVFLAVQPPQATPRAPMAPMMNARLMGAGGEPMFLAAYDPERKAIMVASLAPPMDDPGHIHQLWLIPADGRPRSLGLIGVGASKAMPISEPMAQMAVEGVLLAVTVEPLGGSRLNRPSGPMAAEGKLARL